LGEVQNLGGPRYGSHPVNLDKAPIPFKINHGEGRRKKEEGRRKKEEGIRKRQEGKYN